MRKGTDAEVRNPVFARFYDRLSRLCERQGGADHRTELLAGLHGRVIEVGAGNGLNFHHYPDTVTAVVAVEPEPWLRQRAQGEADRAAVPVVVLDGVADALPADDGEFDAAVASLVLCSVPDQRAALAELARVLRPRGELRFYEHVRAPGGVAGRLQDVVTPVWRVFSGGCHPNRDTVAAIETAGFLIQRLRRFRFPDSRLPNPAAPHVIGSARVPA